MLSPAIQQMDRQAPRRLAESAVSLNIQGGLAARASMTLPWYLLAVDVSAVALFFWYPAWHAVLPFVAGHAVFTGALLLALGRGVFSDRLGHVVLLSMQLALFGSILASGGTLQSPLTILLLVIPGYAFALLPRSEAMNWIYCVGLSAASLFAMECYLLAGSLDQTLALIVQQLPRLYAWFTAYIAFTIFMRVIEAFMRKGQRDTARLHYLANHDQLTRLANRSMFDLCLEKALQKSRRNGDSVALIYVDLDKFKPINDQLGHSVGDEVLQHVAERLVASTRVGDVIARIGGDEFAIVVEGLAPDAETLQGIAEKILARIDMPITTSAGAVSVAGSMGISVYPALGQDLEELKRQADMAMYSAKRSDNAWTIYNEQMSM